MSEFDTFAVFLFEEAKRFLEKANSEKLESGKTAYLHAALLLGISSLEAHVNAIADELLLRNDLGVLERSILSENEITIDRGTFKTRNSLKIYRTIDRIEFIHNSIGSKPIKYASNWWRQLKDALQARNSLVHPKDKVDISSELVQCSLEGVLGCLNSLYLSLYKTKFPAYRRGLHSKLDF